MSIIYGLTGGMGMGKSTVARLMAREGLPVVDSDKLARDVVLPGRPALEEICAAFGRQFVGNNGTLDREKMAAYVFQEPVARKKLEAIIHPRVRELWLESIAVWQSAGKSGVVVIPLLFEVDAVESFEIILCVACTEATQQARLRERGWSDEQIEQRIAAQLPHSVKMERSTHVIWNEGRREILRAQLTRLGCVE